METTYYTINISNFASSYNCSTYGSGAYNQGGECATSTGGGSAGGSSGGGLMDTGVQVVLPIALGIAIIVGAVLLFRKRPKSNKG